MATFVLTNECGDTIEFTGDCRFENGAVAYVWSCEELDWTFQGEWHYSHGPVKASEALYLCQGYKLK